jgi:hypothetical protein
LQRRLMRVAPQGGRQFTFCRDHQLVHKALASKVIYTMGG